MSARRWRVTLQPTEARIFRSVPGDVRLRRALKSLARTFGLRVVALEALSGPIGGEAEPSPALGAPGPPEAP